MWSGSLEALQGSFLPQANGCGRFRSATATANWRYWRWGDGIDSPYPYPLLLPQSQTEQIGLPQNDGGVTADLSHADNEIEKVTVPYLAGCDGAPQPRPPGTWHRL